MLKINKKPLRLQWRLLFAFVSILFISYFTIYIVSITIYRNSEVTQKKADFYRYAIETAQYIKPTYASNNLEVKKSVSQQIQKLTNEISNLQGQQPVRILVINHKGIVEFDSNNDLGPNAFLNRNLGKDYYVISRVLSGEDVQPMDLRIKTGFPKKSTWVLYSYATIDSEEAGNIGMVIISTSLTDVEAVIDTVTFQFLIYTIGAAFFALLASMFISNSITKPIARLTGVIKQMAQGKLNERVQVSGAKELVDLGKSFNIMADKLEHIDRSRSEFVSNASHELRTPLSAVKVLCESLIHGEGVDIETYHEFLVDINTEVDRLGLIVEDLLNLVKLDDEAQHIEFEMVDIAGLVARMVHQLKVLAEKRNINLNVNIEELCSVNGKEIELERAIGNIIDNAIKYTQEGGQVSVNVFENEKRVQIQISDNGPGIHEKHIAFIFDRFYRVDKARSRENGGTGLGLSISKQIIVKHNGYIDVESVVGEGTRFIVNLPTFQM